MSVLFGPGWVGVDKRPPHLVCLCPVRDFFTARAEAMRQLGDHVTVVARHKGEYLGDAFRRAQQLAKVDAQHLAARAGAGRVEAPFQTVGMRRVSLTEAERGKVGAA